MIIGIIYLNFNDIGIIHYILKILYKQWIQEVKNWRIWVKDHLKEWNELQFVKISRMTIRVTGDDISNIEFGQVLPPNLYNPKVLHKTKQEYKDWVLNITEKCPFKSLSTAKT